MVGRTGTKACDVVQSTLTVQLHDSESIESVAETLRYALLQSTSFATVFENYDQVSFLEYLGDDVSGLFPTEDSPLKSDNRGVITAVSGSGNSSGSDNRALAFGLGFGIPAFVALSVYAYSRRGRNNGGEEQPSADGASSADVA